MSSESKRISRVDALKLIDEPKKHPLSLGCTVCRIFGLCGGLHTQRTLYDCTELCKCDDETKVDCQRVCPNNISMLSRRHNEVGGWELDVASSGLNVGCDLPKCVPIIKDGNRRESPLPHSTVALRLDNLISGDWRQKCSTRSQLAERYKIRDDAHFIINGIGFDGPLERYWSHPDRVAIAAQIASLQPLVMTTPNFSLFTDVVRHENFYNMKRIAVIWHELTESGVRTALHLNARTNRDWQRWREFLDGHPEIRYVAFEFGTGAGGKRRAWYVHQLKRLADEALQPLSLVVRGGIPALASLSHSFDQVCLLSMNAYMKSINRRQLYVFGNRLRDRRAHTASGQPIDELLNDNILAEQRFVEALVDQQQPELLVLE